MKAILKAFAARSQTFEGNLCLKQAQLLKMQKIILYYYGSKIVKLYNYKTQCCKKIKELFYNSFTILDPHNYTTIIF